MTFPKPSLTISEEYARRKGWSLARGNIMVEGNLDERYLHLASLLYERDSGLRLIGRDLSVFSVGTGDEGGTFSVCEQFPTLRNLSKNDLDENGKIKFRVVTLLDNDDAGRAAIRIMKQANRSFKDNEDVFLLNRHMPRKSRDSRPLTEHIKLANQAFSGFDCEIEDLLSKTLCELYCDEHPNHRSSVEDREGYFHAEWSEDGKHGLVRFAEKIANLQDVYHIVEVLKSMRFYLGLPTDGK